MSHETVQRPSLQQQAQQKEQSQPPRGLPLVIASVLLALGALLSGALMSVWLSRPPVIQQALYYPEGRAVPAFELRSHRDQPWDNRQLLGKWTLAYIGYASCPDICPSTLAELARWYETLGDEERQDLQLLFISVDPERDSPTILANYIHYFHPDFLAATAGHNQLFPLTRALGLLYSLSDSQSAMGYTVDHSTRIALLDPTGKLRAMFDAKPPQGINPRLLSEDLRAIRQRW